jgi:ABC-type glycerol-3-phosphate transport system permease component
MNATLAIPSRVLEKMMTYLVILALVTVFIFPLVWLIISSLKTETSLMAWPIQWLPDTPRWENYVQVLIYPAYKFLRGAQNSLVLALMFSIPNVFSSAMVGYAFARLNAPGRKRLLGLLMAMLIMPHSILVLPQFVLYSRVGLVNNYLLWMLWGLAGSPFQIVLFRQFFTSFPVELEDAAAIDGASPFTTFVRIFLPNAKAVFAVTFLFAFGWVWGDWFNQTLYLTDSKATLAMKLATAFVDPMNQPIVTLTFAGIVLYTIPLVLVYLLMQRQIVQGIVTTGLKG